MKTAYVEVRSQSPQGTWPHQGPDTYVSVQVVPLGVSRLISLNHRAAKLRGIEIIHCGEGYRENQKSGRSMLSVAIAKAKEIAAKINTLQLLIDA